jgi:hypothetical protein
MTDKEIDDINDSWALALQCYGLSANDIHALRQTVEDAISNNMDGPCDDVHDPEGS